LTRQFLASRTRSLAIDSQSEYGGLVVNDPFAVADYLNARGTDLPFRIAYRETGDDGGTEPGDLFKMLQACRNMWLAVEEASKYMGPTQGSPQLNWFFQYGRHHAISVLCVARRPSELGRIATAQADVIVTFRQHEPRDLEWIRAVGGAECAERVAALGDHEWTYIVRAHPEIEAALDSLSHETGATGEPAVETPALDNQPPVDAGKAGTLDDASVVDPVGNPAPDPDGRTTAVENPGSVGTESTGEGIERGKRPRGRPRGAVTRGTGNA